MVWLVIIAILSAILLICWRLTFPKNFDKLSKMKGPPRLPVIGNFHLLKSEISDQTAQFFDWVDQYGSPMLLKLGPKCIVYITEAEHVQTMLTSTANITKGYEYDMMVPWIGRGLLTGTGPEWHKRRKQLTPAFHMQILRDFVPIFNEHAQQLLGVLDTYADNGKIVEVAHYLELMALDIICETAMGKKIDFLHSSKSDYVKAVATFSQLSTWRFDRPWLWTDTVFLLTKEGKEWKRANDIMFAFTSSIIREREALLKHLLNSDQRRLFSADESDDSKKKHRKAFLDLLLELKSEGSITDRELFDEVETFMFAGHDTTAGSLGWALWLLGGHPEVQQKLFDEIVKNGCEKEFISADDVAPLKYMDAVIKESLRLFPISSFISRTLDEDMKIAEFTLPAGTDVNVYMYKLHYDPKYFPEPYNFIPERFLPENSSGRHPFAYVPFSAGLRNCIGQKFALLQEKIVLCHLLRRFRFRSTQTREEVKPTEALTLKPANGITMEVIRREDV